MSKNYSDLRSARWYASQSRAGHVHRQRTAQGGFSRLDYEGKPVVGIFSTWSDLNPCHAHFRQRVDDVKRGVWQAGGFPVEVPVMSIGEPFIKPSALLYRNMLAMEVEEMLRAHPIDGVVLMGGCDKTTPAMLMGAISMGLPALFLPAGPMLTGRWRGKPVGSGTDTSRLFMELSAGTITRDDIQEEEVSSARSPGHCMTMGTASTMTAVAETIGFSLPGSSSIPAPDSRHQHMASMSGRRMVEMIREDLKPADILDERSFENAITVLAALGGSTNAVIHLLAIAGRAGVSLDLAKFESIMKQTPVLANVKPVGIWLMEDFFEAGGLRGLMARLSPLLDLSARTVTGNNLGDGLSSSRIYNEDVIRPLERPVSAGAGLVVLRGNLAPDGCLLKKAAASESLLQHKGRAVVFRDFADLNARIDLETLDVDENSVLILQNAGPRGVPGMPEWGMIPIPKKLLARGVRDMVRISDARMSGTHFGTVVLHVAPEAAAGGTLALVQEGDVVELDTAGRRLTLHVGDSELEARRAKWSPPPAPIQRGWGRLFHDQVSQANKGCDLQFLEAGPSTKEPWV